MSSSRAQLTEALDALRDDLVHEEGPRISTMRNHRFAIVPYNPADEFFLRQKVQVLSNDLVAHGWRVLSISLHKLLLDRIQQLDAELLSFVIETERSLTPYSFDRSINSLKEALAPLVEGVDGLAADCARIIGAHVAKAPDQADRTLALIGRGGALYPLFRSSALLRHLDGRTGHVPVVLLYPGERAGQSGLSFMGELSPDQDYRPRIYP